MSATKEAYYAKHGKYPDAEDTMTPDEKTAYVNKFLDSLALALFGRSRTDCINANICVVCGGELPLFNNEAAWHKYTVSGMCQVCQDKPKED